MFAALALIAVATEAAAGYPDGIYRRIGHPVTWIGALITWCDQAWNSETLSHGERCWRGIYVLVLLLSAGILSGLAITAVLDEFFHDAVALLLAGAAGSSMLAQRSLYTHVGAVASALETDGIEAGRRAVSMIVGRDTRALDEAAVSRAAIESLAENFSDAVVGPAFWYLLLGLPGVMAYKCVNTLDSMIGHTSARYRRFGAPTAYADTALNFIPARLSALLLAAAASFVPNGRPWRALKLALRDARKHRSKNAGWPEAAMAGAVSVSLAGPRVYGGEAVKDAWLGQEFTARAMPSDIHRALAIYAIACLILLALVLLGVGAAVAF